MTDLKALRNQIRSLLRRRRAARYVMGWSALLLAAIWLMLGLFLVDVLFEMTRIQLLIALLVAAALLAWVIYRHVRPWLAYKEDAIDMALRVERHRKIDSDLVAAMQFELPAAATWGSPQLERAVIHRVAEDTRRWNLAGDVPQSGLRRRLAFLAATFAVIAAILLVFPNYLAIFPQRLAFESTFYPRDTVILKVLVNNRPQEVLRSSDAVDHCPFGRPVEFRIICSGKLPKEGTVTIRPAGEGAPLVIPAKALENESGSYAGRLDHMDSTFDFMVSVGDARTKWGRLIVSPPPIVEPIFRPTIPDHARAAGIQPAKEGSSKRQFSVYEGARVDLEVRCLNKRLKTVAMVVAGVAHPLQEASGDGRLWKLPSQGTPFSEITEPIEYKIEAIDEDDLKPLDEIGGAIELVTDLPPSIEADIANRHEVHVLPTAKPRIRYRINDDYGVGGLTMELTVRRGGVDAAPQSFPIPIQESTAPVPVSRLPLDAKFSFDLADFQVSKGDEVKIVLSATDYRGRRRGRSTPSAPLTLKITDQIGALTAITQEADTESERMIRQIINRAAGIERTKP